MAALPLALPAAGAALAYLSARYNLSNDLAMLKTAIWGYVKTERDFRNGTGNLFYKLEAHALSPKTADHCFLAVPPAILRDENHTPESVARLRCREWSYRQVYELVLRYAAWLKEDLKVDKDDIVALDFQNKPEFVYIWYAIWSLGARPAFLNTGLRGDGLLHCIKTSTAKVAIFDAAIEGALSDGVGTGLESIGVRIAVVDDATMSAVAGRQGYRACDDCRSGVGPLDMAQLIFTSGTTGLPKPAVVNWRRNTGIGNAIGSFLELKPTDRYYTALPLYHSSASLLAVNVALSAGITIILAPHFSAGTFFASLTASRATLFQYIGEMCRYLLKVPPTRFDTAHTVTRAFGNGLRPDVWCQFKERYSLDQICEFYSATESPASTFIRSRNNFGEGAIGRSGPLVKLHRGVDTMLIKHDIETGEPVRDPSTGLCISAKVGEAGEFLAALDAKDVQQSFAGYWGNEEASQKKVLRDVVKKGDAYFRTGDLLRIDKEGRVFFVDRIGDTFRWKGENVSTGEVEKVLAAHPSVQEANVYGVELPGYDGRAGCAAIMFKESPPTAKDLHSLAQHVLRSLPRFAAPLFLRSVRSMETTGTAKYTKHGLRSQGVEHGRVGGDCLYWLEPETGVYADFTPTDWQSVSSGRVRL